ncbi:MAG: DUF2007 domain-containing protein [Cryomorphaceae bacterium]
MNPLVRLMTGSSITIQRMVALLEEHNISSQMKDNVESARAAGFGVPQNSVELHVYESDAEKAQQIIKDFQKAQEN